MKVLNVGTEFTLLNRRGNSFSHTFKTKANSEPKLMDP